jgi:hypothetical protein
MAEDEQGAASGQPDGLPRIRAHRRLLEVMSLVCAAYCWFHITINTQSNLMGIPVHIGSTRYAFLALCIGLGWAAWRYGQQLYSASQSVRAAMRIDYRTELSRLARKVVQRYVSRMSASDRRAFGAENSKPRVVGVALLGRFDFQAGAPFRRK